MPAPSRPPYCVPMVRFSDLQTVTIPSGDTHSDPIYIEFGAWVSLVIPTITGATITFEATVDNGLNWFAVLDENSVPVSLTIGAGPKGYFLPQAVMPYSTIRVVSASSEGSLRTLTVSQKS